MKNSWRSAQLALGIVASSGICLPAFAEGPTVASLIPPFATVGAPPQTLTINGTNYTATSTVTYDGIEHDAILISPTQLAIALTSNDLAAEGPHAVVVTNPAPNGGASTPIYFVVQQAPASGSWISLGPHHVIGQAGELESGKLQAFAVFNSDPNVMYAGGGIGQGISGPLTAAGAWKTTDGGAHWARINVGLSDPQVNTLWVDQTNPNTVIAGTENAGIFKSVDGGLTWNPTGRLGATSEFVSAGSTLFAATAAGIALSTDVGSTWTLTLPTTVPVRALAAGGGAMIAGLEDGTVIMQAPAAPAWKTVIPNRGPNRTAYSVAVSPLSATNAYVVLSDSGKSQLLGTGDGGSTWVTLLPSYTLMSKVAIPDAGAVIYVAGNGVLFRSDDNGQTWNPLPNPGLDMRKIDVVGQSTLFVCSDQGIHKSTDGGNSWVGITGPVYSSILTGLAVSGSTIIAAVQDFSPILSFDGGSNWQQPGWTIGLPVGEDGIAVINPGDSRYCYLHTTSGYQYSTDNCRTFHFSSPPAGFPFHFYGADIVAVDPNSPVVVYVITDSGVLHSTDWGVTLAPANWKIPPATAIAVSPGDSNTIYVGTTTGLYRTKDRGASWQQIGMAGAAGQVSTIAIDPLNPMVVLVGLTQGPAIGGGVLKSVDGGATFHLSNSGLSTAVKRPTICCGIDMESLRFGPDSLLALATSTGIYLSKDLGDTWQNITVNAISTYFSDVAWDSGFLYAATYGEGVVRLPIGQISSQFLLGASSLSFNYTIGGGTPKALPVTVSSSFSSLSFTATPATDSGGSWLMASPASGTSPATLNVSVNPAGLLPGNYTGRISVAESGSHNGAFTIRITLQVAAAVTSSIPIIKSVGNAASYQPGMAPNTWIVIQGENLSLNTGTWTNAIINGILPTSLDGVSVMVGGSPAYIAYVSPTQINALAPNLAAGAVSLTVTNSSGTSAPVNTVAQATQPAFFQWGSYAVATRQDYSLVVRNGTFPGIATLPAKPGEVVILWGTGFGATNPSAPAGAVVPSDTTYNTASNVSVTVGGVQAMVYGTALAPWFVGLYEVAIQIPGSLVDGDYPVIATISGTPTPSSTLITVQN